MKTKISIVMLVLGCLIVASVYAAQESSKEEVGEPISAGEATAPKTASLQTEQDKISYVIGTQLGQNFKTQGIEIKIESFVLGLQDALAGKELAITQDEMKLLMRNFQRTMLAKQATKNLSQAMAFLEANKAKEGVKVLPSGLQYKVITEGTGNTPTTSDKVKTHYRGTLISGTEFDSSYKRDQPAEFPVTGVIKGWTEALQLMKEGSKWQLYIPPNLAYGERGRPGIPPNSMLIFEIELLEVLK